MTSKQGCLMELAENERVAYLDKLYSTTAPFTHFGNDDLGGIIDPHTLCPVAAARQHASSSGGTAGASHATCYAGWTCRFLGAHAQQPGDGKGVDGTGWELTGSNQTHVDGQSDDAIRRNAPDERNWLPQWVPRALKTREYPLHLTKAALKRLADEVESTELERRGPIYIDEDAARRVYGTRPTTSSNGAHSGGQKGPADQQYDGDDDDDDLDQLMNGGPLARKPAAVEEERRAMRVYDAAHSICDVDVARIRPSEKRRLDWFHDELYLAPLTTTGNLPFRRLCTSYGADITCGEMGLAESYLTGSKNEWSLVRRWEGERCFGTQLCGSKPDLLVPTAEALAREFQGGLDFIDVNCGCPIDMVFSRGGGSALLDHGAKLGRIVRGMSAVTGDVPITVKLRTGTGSAQTTHKLFPKIKVDWDAGAATMHGRSRQQRYKHLADWDFIRRCATALRDSITQNNEERPDEEWVHPIPVYGNGDVYSWQDYEANKALTGVDGEMVARGALIKPWLFTEIKERRDWDISSRERLDIVRQLSSYGLTHWGSDSLGVNQTRRFVCEALSFMHRYIPIGLLERLPVSMNDRPPAFAGRDDLETLLASSNARDWVRVSEMFLGKAPEPWSFTRACLQRALPLSLDDLLTDAFTFLPFRPRRSQAQVQLLRRRHRGKPGVKVRADTPFLFSSSVLIYATALLPLVRILNDNKETKSGTVEVEPAVQKGGSGGGGGGRHDADAVRASAPDGGQKEGKGGQKEGQSGVSRLLARTPTSLGRRDGHPSYYL